MIGMMQKRRITGAGDKKVSEEPRSSKARGMRSRVDGRTITYSKRPIVTDNLCHHAGSDACTWVELSNSHPVPSIFLCEVEDELTRG